MEVPYWDRQERLGAKEEPLTEHMLSCTTQRHQSRKYESCTGVRPRGTRAGCAIVALVYDAELSEQEMPELFWSRTQRYQSRRCQNCASVRPTGTMESRRCHSCSGVQDRGTTARDARVALVYDTEVPEQEMSESFWCTTQRHQCRWCRRYSRRMTQRYQSRWCLSHSAACHRAIRAGNARTTLAYDTEAPVQAMPEELWRMTQRCQSRWCQSYYMANDNRTIREGNARVTLAYDTAELPEQVMPQNTSYSQPFTCGWLDLNKCCLQKILRVMNGA